MTEIACFVLFSSACLSHRKVGLDYIQWSLPAVTFLDFYYLSPHSLFVFLPSVFRSLKSRQHLLFVWKVPVALEMLLK